MSTASEPELLKKTWSSPWPSSPATRVASSIVGGDLSDRFGRKRLIAAGWLVYALVYAGFAYADTRGEVWLLFLIYGAYFGLVEGAEKALYLIDGRFTQD